MALIIKTLSEGKFGTTAGTVYDLSGTNGVPTGKAWIVKSMRFTNTDTTNTVKINIYYLKQSGGTGDRRLITPVDLSLAPGASAIDEAELTLSVGEKIQGKASVGSDKIDYVFSGVERDVS